MISLPTVFVILSSLVLYVSAHGYVVSVSLNGDVELGWAPFVDPYATPTPQRIVRHVPSDGPIFDIDSPDLACNAGGESGTSRVADINAGSDIVFQWTNWPADHLGPVSTYMASCNGDCTTFSTSDAQWFKVDAGGYTNGEWASTQLIANGNTWTSTIPAGLASGQYLVRNEIVALHSAGQPQYYPACAQVNVVGGGSGTPSSSSLVSIPGVYDGSEFPNIWLDSFNSFTIPGPAPVSFSAGGGSPAPPAASSSSPSPAVSSGPASPSSPPSTTTETVPTETSQCRATRRRRSLARHVQRRSH